MAAPRRSPKNPKGCHERALGLLAVRPRSRRELADRLGRAGFDPAEVAEELSRLEAVGLIDDEAFARQVAAYQFGSRKAGRRAVTSALLGKGVAPDLAASIAAEGDGGEASRAQDLADSRARRLHGVEPAKAFSRITSLLLRRGYDPDVARRAARQALDVEVGQE